MKRSIIICLIIIIGVLGYLASYNWKNSQNLTIPQKSVLSSTMSNRPAKPESGVPIQISIPKLSLLSKIEQVGLDAKNNMDVPKAAENAGWYKYGTLPGEKGNAVLAGHLDKADGTPAIFYNLKKLQVGDSIVIEDDKNQKYTYIVTEMKNYPYDKFPLTRVFGTTDKYQLNLITCDGVFDKTAKNYSERTVIYAELAR